MNESWKHNNILAFVDKAKNPKLLPILDHVQIVKQETHGVKHSFISKSPIIVALLQLQAPNALNANKYGCVHGYSSSRVNRPVIEHIVSQSPLSHSICLLSSCGLKIKCSQVESAPMGLYIT
jgi:hypothetical protein